MQHIFRKIADSRYNLYLAAPLLYALGTTALVVTLFFPRTGISPAAMLAVSVVAYLGLLGWLAGRSSGRLDVKTAWFARHGALTGLVAAIPAFVTGGLFAAYEAIFSKPDSLLDGLLGVMALASAVVAFAIGIGLALLSGAVAWFGAWLGR